MRIVPTPYAIGRTASRVNPAVRRDASVGDATIRPEATTG
jgi:hypothetical protein